MSVIKEMKTTTKTTPNKALDVLLWSLIVVVLAASVWINYHFQSVDASLRVIAWIVAVIVMLMIAYLTTQGKRAWAFAKDSQAELRKVVWPTRPETIQTTLLVLALVIVLALIIWGLDSFLLWAIGLLTGQRG